MKDDTLGLGAGSRRDPFNGPTGLGAFKGLLGRLNGKPEAQLEEEERNREDARLARYAATKWQTVRFISGGLLTQEKAESLRPKPSREDTGSNPELHNVPAAKRYKASDGNSESSTGHTQATTKPPKKRKSKKARTEQVDEEASKSERRKEKQTKKRKHNREDSSSTAPGERDTSQSESGNGPSKQKQLPTATVSKERRPMGRHILRGRHMDAKKKALLDDKSLSEVFHLSTSWRVAAQQLEANPFRSSWSNPRIVRVS